MSRNASRRQPLLAAISLALSLHAQADYPERNLQGIIPWGAGGATDNVMRTLTPFVEQSLGGKIILNNRPGGTAVIGSFQVLRQAANGYTLLMGAENPQLYPVLGVAAFDYSDFYPVNIIGQNIVVIAVHPDSPWQSFADLLKAAQEQPETLRMGAMGAGALANTVHALISAETSLPVREVNFGGEGPAITALLGQHIDFVPLSLAGAGPLLASGKLKALTVLSKDAIPELPDVPPVTRDLPQLSQYLPWGPFWGIWVRKETPESTRQALVTAYAEAVAQPEFQQFLKRFGAQSLNLHGQPAEDYLRHWQSVTAWSMYKAGTLQKSPETLGIPKP